MVINAWPVVSKTHRTEAKASEKMIAHVIMIGMLGLYCLRVIAPRGCLHVTLPTRNTAYTYQRCALRVITSTNFLRFSKIIAWIQHLDKTRCTGENCILRGAGMFSGRFFPLGISANDRNRPEVNFVPFGNAFVKSPIGNVFRGTIKHGEALVSKYSHENVFHANASETERACRIACAV